MTKGEIWLGYAQAYKCTAQLAVDALGKAVKEYDVVCAKQLKKYKVFVGL